MNDFKRLVINPETIHPLDKTFKDNFQINNFLNNLIRNPFLTLSYQMKVLLQKRKIGNFINKPNKYQLKSIFR